MVKQSIDEEVVKKADLLEFRAEIKLDIALMKNDIADMKVEIGGMKGEIGGIKAEIGEMKGEIKTLHAKIDSLGTDLIKKLGGLIIVLYGLGLDWGKGYDFILNLLEKITTHAAP